MRDGFKALSLTVTLAILLTGCKREPDFNERYQTATKAVVDKAKSIDAQIQATDVPVAEEEKLSVE